MVVLLLPMRYINDVDFLMKSLILLQGKCAALGVEKQIV